MEKFPQGPMEEIVKHLSPKSRHKFAQSSRASHTATHSQTKKDKNTLIEKLAAHIDSLNDFLVHRMFSKEEKQYYLFKYRKSKQLIDQFFTKDELLEIAFPFALFYSFGEKNKTVQLQDLNMTSNPKEIDKKFQEIGKIMDHREREKPYIKEFLSTLSYPQLLYLNHMITVVSV